MNLNGKNYSIVLLYINLIQRWAIVFACGPHLDVEFVRGSQITLFFSQNRSDP